MTSAIHTPRRDFHTSSSTVFVFICRTHARPPARRHARVTQQSGSDEAARCKLSPGGRARCATHREARPWAPTARAAAHTGASTVMPTVTEQAGRRRLRTRTGCSAVPSDTTKSTPDMTLTTTASVRTRFSDALRRCTPSHTHARRPSGTETSACLQAARGRAHHARPVGNGRALRRCVSWRRPVLGVRRLGRALVRVVLLRRVSAAACRHMRMRAHSGCDSPCRPNAAAAAASSAARL